MKRALSFILCAVALMGCQEEQKQTEAPIKAVKTIRLKAAGEAAGRQITGVVKTADKTSLSFRVGGRVSKVTVKEGGYVNKGAILAQIEQRDYRLALESTQAKLASARADLAEKKEKLRRQEILRQKDIVAQAAVDQARAAYQLAKSNVTVAQTNMKAAELDLQETVLRAPFAGKVASRQIDPYAETSPGKTVFELQGDDGYKVELLVPETLIRHLDYADPVTVTFPTQKDLSLKGAVLQIGAEANAGNAFPVTVDLLETDADIRAGMTAKVALNLDANGNAPVFLVPVTALDLRVEAEGDLAEKGQAKVFLVDPATNRLTQRYVSISDVRGNEFEVLDGLSAGDILVVAGVPFLSDGQEVKIWQPDYNRPARLQD